VGRCDQVGNFIGSGMKRLHSPSVTDSGIHFFKMHKTLLLNPYESVNVEEDLVLTIFIFIW
jgi:hypothetical protein